MELKLPPVLVFILCMLLAMVLTRFLPGLRLPGGLAADVLYWALMGAAALILLVSQWQFYRAGTSVNPMRPDAASRLLQSGVFAFSRNPVYLAMLLVILALAWRQGQASGLLGAVVFYLYLTRYQILPEERALEQRFGDEYRAYRARVRRWL